MSKIEESRYEAAGVRTPASLLVGPTGSGKTPLGEHLEVHGLWRRPCVHFDFGANLRQYAAGGGAAGVLTDDERAVLRGVLEAGTLLEDRQFPMAQKILGAFLHERAADGRTWVVLNGLPRHVGQAHDLEAMVDVEVVVHLVCRAEVVLERVRTNAGGDRVGRCDDGVEALRWRIALFEGRTAPLVAWYAARGARVEGIEVEVGTTAEAMWRQLMRDRGAKK